MMIRQIVSYLFAAIGQTASDLAEVYCNKGVALGSQGKYDEAIKAYDEAIRLNPNYAPTWVNKGRALKALGKYDDAIRAYDKAIWLDPKLAPIWNNKGLTLHMQGKYDDAIKAYDKAIGLNPYYADACMMMLSEHMTKPSG